MKIVLVRHGRSAHVLRELVDLDEFHRWRDAYEAAGIDAQEEPPAALRAVASSSDVIVSSTAPRAVESAKLLAPAREVITTPLLSELELLPPRIRGIRMPLILWAVAIGVRALFRGHSSVELQRSRDAVQWLTELAQKHETIVAVTHASLRALLAKRLMEHGWTCKTVKRTTRHWSVWTFTQAASQVPVSSQAT